MENTPIDIQAALADAKGQQIDYFPLQFAELLLYATWYPPVTVEPRGGVLRQAARPDDLINDSSPAAKSPKRPPPWYLGLSKSFSKAITGIDRKLQGRILEALADIVADPVTPRGDTVKPLRRALEGCWRYRIGDYRLVYSPNVSNGDITLLTFAARGSIYDD